VLFEIKNIHLIKPKQLKIKYKYLFSFLSPSFQLLCSFITLNQELFQKYKHFVKKRLIVFNINLHNTDGSVNNMAFPAAYEDVLTVGGYDTFTNKRCTIPKVMFSVF